MYSSWYFFRMLLENAELSLMKADMQIAALYSALAPNQVSAEQIFADIQTEYQNHPGGSGGEGDSAGCWKTNRR